MLKHVKKWIPRLLVIVLITFVMGEIGIRLMGRTNADGQFFFRQWAIDPLIISEQAMIQNLTDYLEADEEALQIYDDTLGWAYQPNYVDEERGITINNMGIRADRDYTLIPEDNVLRIAVFGDSFVFGHEVADDEAWVYLLENLLQEQGLRVEIMNFGVSGYAMDQVYLRWLEMGQQYQADWIIFGFLGSDIDRSMGIFRSILLPSSHQPFTKPRFILEDEQLQLVNSPTVPLDEIEQTITDYKSHPLFQYETRYDERYEAHWWQNSKLLATLVFYAKLTYQEPWEAPTDDIFRESKAVNSAIIQQFGEDVTASDAQFSTVYLPRRRDLWQIYRGEKPYYWSMLEDIAEIYPVFWGEQVFTYDDPDFWALRWHYSALGNQMMAEFMADELMSCIESDTCTFSRFASVDDFRVGS